MTIYGKGCISNYRNCSLSYVWYSVLYRMLTEYDYPQFHLRMHCFWCSIAQGALQLKEHQSAQWLAKEEWESVDWLPADVLVLAQLG